MSTTAPQENPIPDPRLRLIELMARLALRDGIALFELVDEFGNQLRHTVRRGLEKLKVQAHPDLIEELVMEAALVVQQTARGWSPDGGAYPWNWAERRIYARISAYIGQHHDSLDPATNHDAPAAPLAGRRDDTEDEWTTLAAMANRRPELQLLELALTTATTVAERALLLSYEALKADGDPSPANTLGTELAMAPATVRQRVRRTKVKVNNLVQSDERFAAIRALPLLR